jgi:aquaporin Z
MTAIRLMAMPVSNASVNPARSLGSALFGSTTALGQLWRFRVVPIVGGETRSRTRPVPTRC